MLFEVLEAGKLPVMDEQTIFHLATKAGTALKSRGLLLTSAESCTGGWVAQAITAVPGSSGWFERGFITYSDLSKYEMLGVSPVILNKHGAVSEQTAREMAKGALKNSPAHISLAVTGIAGPAGGSESKPVGTVCFAWIFKETFTKSKTYFFEGSREAVRCQSVNLALRGILNLLDEMPAANV